MKTKSTHFADVAASRKPRRRSRRSSTSSRIPPVQKLGGKIPKGVLMVGSRHRQDAAGARHPGEAKVPFFTISGSDFVEMFSAWAASRGARHVRAAKKHAPCIISIDEIDAVGRHRGARPRRRGRREREQTLNQLLVEMDGFEGNEGIIVIAATNRRRTRSGAAAARALCRQVWYRCPMCAAGGRTSRCTCAGAGGGDDVKPSLDRARTPASRAPTSRTW